MAFQLPKLSYGYEALEPHIDGRTMQIHYEKHHGTYVEKLNAALQKAPEFQNKPIDEIVRSLDRIPGEIRTVVRNNGGGHYNHSLFWTMMAPNAGGRPQGTLLKEIENAFGSFDSFKEKFSAAAVGQFGSGWAWLGLDRGGKLAVIGMPNQDPPTLQGLNPILGVDVWEHAYYLKYQNRRADYVAAWWNVVNWKQVAEYFDRAKSR
jgi:Fe-Mn family superoxide dismutase